MMLNIKIINNLMKRVLSNKINLLGMKKIKNLISWAIVLVDYKKMIVISNKSKDQLL